MWHNGFVDPGWFFVAGLFKFLWFVFLIGALFWALRFFRRMRYAGAGGWGGSRGWGRHPMMGMFNGRDDALETARQRLARSEITPEQFEDLKRNLQSEQARAEDAWRNRERGEWRGFARSWNRDDALETARMRLARGEISAEEFQMIRRALEN
jgi:uncharacterized membrane protein